MATPELPPSSAHVHAPAQPLRTGLRLLMPLWCIGALLLVLTLVLTVVLGLAGRWLLRTPDGGRWLLAHVPGLQVQGFDGVLWAGNWRADKLRVQWDGNKKWVEVEQLRVEGVQWQWQPQAQVWLGLQARSVVARRVVVDTGPPSGLNPLPLPASIAPPLQLRFGQVRATELQINTLPLVRDVALDALLLDARPGANFTTERFSFDGFGVVAAGQLRMANVAPLALNGHAAVRPSAEGDNPRWGAVLDATGSLSELKLSTLLRGRPVAGHDAPALDAQATLRPLYRWWLAALKLQTQALDLAALTASAPTTQLSGTAELTSLVANQPLVAQVQLDNAAPGRWDEQRVPVQKLSLQAQGEVTRPDRLALPRFELQLADSKGSAGRITGSAVWQGHELSLDTVLSQVTPQRLDARASAMTLGGPIQATLRGLPSPDLNTSAVTTPPAFSADWKLDLSGQLDNRPQPVQLQMQAKLDAQRLHIETARAQAGTAVAELRGDVIRLPTGAWQVQSTGNLRDFDPQPWWPGDSNPTWRQGPHRVSGQWQFDVRVPTGTAQLAPLTLLQRLAGNGTLNLRDSLLAGVPMAADVTLSSTAATASTANTASKIGDVTATSITTVGASVRLAGNELQLEGRADPGGNGEADRWRLDLRADALAGLAPLTRLHPDLADWVPRQGSVQITLAADGRWPRLRSEGTAHLSQLHVGMLRVTKGNASWRMDTRTDTRNEQPLAMQLDLSGLQLAEQRADNLHAELRGTLADHHIDVSGALPVLPPALAMQMLGIRAQSGTRAQLQAQGAWRADAAGGGTWKARVERLLLGSWDGAVAGSRDSRDSGTPSTAASTTNWAETGDLNATLKFDAEGDWVSLQADAGRLRLGQGQGQGQAQPQPQTQTQLQPITLRWDDVRATRSTAGGANKADGLMNWQLKAEIEPFALAPLLARAQPTLGWRGDLRLAARMDIRAGEKMEADLSFERRDGDLQLVSEGITQAMGLTDFKFNVVARDGLWRFTQSLRGKTLGEMDGEARVQTTADKRWPAPNAPIDGKLQVHVADIGTWGNWVPAAWGGGWRLLGEVRSTASVSGMFGDWRYTGELTGSGLGLRNPLLGVNVRDGQLTVRLAGDTAQIENFTLKGGDGQIEVLGGLVLGKNAQALVQLKAERFRVLGRVDAQLVTSGNAALVLDSEQIKLDGKFTIDEGQFDARQNTAPSLDDDVVVTRASDVKPEPADPQAPKNKFKWLVAVEVDAGQKLRVTGRGLDTGLRGQLRLGAPGGRPVINGSINTDNGTYVAYGQKLEIERGILSFSGDYNNPRMDILALRPNIDVRAGVAITGNVLTPRIRLFSEPEMSDADKLSWLVLGRAQDGLGRNDTALLQRAAIALLAGENEAPTDALLKSLGIDDISVRQGDTTVRETVVSIGKQLSRRWYLGYERGVNATTGTWQLTYRIAQQFTLRAQSGLDNALDVIWTWRLQEARKPGPADASAPNAPAPASVRKSIPAPP